MLQKILLPCILLLALFLRTYKLEANPPGFYSDEASWAYNAYSIMLTGRDEYGRYLPWVFEAFGDFKLPVTVYSIVPSYWLFGVSNWSARLPTAIYGVLSILAVYFLVKELLRPNNQITNHKSQKIINDQITKRKLENEYLPLVSALLLAIAPAHIFLSRGIWDIQPALFLLTIGALFFIKAINSLSNSDQKIKVFGFFLVSSLSFALSMYSYNSARVVTPLLIIILTLGFSRQLYSFLILKFSFFNLCTIIIPIIAGAILLLPQLQSLTNPEVTQRARFVSIFNRGDVESKIFGATAADGSENPIWLIRLLHNKPVFYASEIAQRYLQHFDLNYLFLTGDTFEIFKVEGIGILPLVTLPFLIIGLVALLRDKPKWMWIIISWLLIAPIPSALTIFTPSVSRAHNMIVPLVIITAYGIATFINFGNSNLFRASNFGFRIYLIIIGGILLLNLTYWYGQYFILTPMRVAHKWGSGWEQVAAYISQNQNTHHNIYISNTQGPSYIWLAWYQRLDPQYVWQARVTDFKPDSNGLNTTSKLGEYNFTKDLKNDCTHYTHSNPTICVGFAGEIGGSSQKITADDHNLVFEVLKK